MNYARLQRKFLLLDTNILIGYSKYAKFFVSFLTKLNEQETVFVLDKHVEFEFLRGAESKDEIGVLEAWLETVFGKNKQDFSAQDEILKSAISIANIYKWKLKNSKIEITDCILTAQLEKYNKTNEVLFLATANHSDFPTLFLDRFGIETIDTGESIVNICFYAFNRTNFENIKKSFLEIQ